MRDAVADFCLDQENQQYLLDEEKLWLNRNVPSLFTLTPVQRAFYDREGHFPPPYAIDEAEVAHRQRTGVFYTCAEIKAMAQILARDIAVMEEYHEFYKALVVACYRHRSGDVDMVPYLEVIASAKTGEMILIIHSHLHFTAVHNDVFPAAAEPITPPSFTLVPNFTHFVAEDANPVYTGSSTASPSPPPSPSPSRPCTATACPTTPPPRSAPKAPPPRRTSERVRSRLSRTSSESEAEKSKKKTKINDSDISSGDDSSPKPQSGRGASASAKACSKSSSSATKNAKASSKAKAAPKTKRTLADFWTDEGKQAKQKKPAAASPSADSKRRSSKKAWRRKHTTTKVVHEVESGSWSSSEEEAGGPKDAEKCAPKPAVEKPTPKPATRDRELWAAWAIENILKKATTDLQIMECPRGSLENKTAKYWGVGSRTASVKRSRSRRSRPA